MTRSHTNDRESVCLTFDDGPDPVWTPRILDALGEARARATFFVITPRAIRYSHLVERMVSEGHEVALHCERHIRHSEIGEDEILHDASQGLADLGSLGIHPTNWRTPWGIATAGTLRIADEFGLSLVHWTEDTHDWQGDSADIMHRQISPNLRGGSVVLMHDGIGPGATREGCGETVSLVTRLLDDLHLEGLEAVTVAELCETRHSGRVGISTV